jgi:queuosine precursor transporter
MKVYHKKGNALLMKRSHCIICSMPTKQKPIKQFRYLDVITGLFVSILLISNVASSKITAFGPFEFDGGTILFPLSYIFGDILTEVYGYGRDRKIIWIGLTCNILMAAVFMIVGALPSAHDWHNQSAYDAILGLTPRIVLGSVVAYFVGEFANSFTMAKMKIATKGKYLWTRTVSSTLISEFFDTLIFGTIAFAGFLSTQDLIALLISNYIFKVGVEVIFTPITYAVVNFLKKKENEDYYDRKTNFNPFMFQRK